MFRFLLLLFLIVPMVEIYILIKVGGVIGAGWTIFSVVATAVIGAALLRKQGASTLLRAQQNMQKGGLPALEMMEGIALAASGLLLLTPGFATDIFGFLLLVPMFRRGLIKKMLAKSIVSMHSQTHYSQSSPTDPNIIEGEIVDEHNDQRVR